MSVGIGSGLRFDPGASNSAYATGDNELPVQRALVSVLRPGDVVLDVGANVGFLTVIMARLVGSAGHVYAFEPVPANAALIRRNARRNGFRHVTVLEQAVAAQAGRAELVLAAYSGGAALASADRPPDAVDSIDVEVVTVDIAVADGRVRSPQLVKIDVEGAELAVLEGMTRTIGDARPIVLCEVDAGDADRFASKRQACIDHLEEAGYDVRVLDDSYPPGGWIVGHLLAEPRSPA